MGAASVGLSERKQCSARTKRCLRTNAARRLQRRRGVSSLIVLESDPVAVRWYLFPWLWGRGGREPFRGPTHRGEESIGPKGIGVAVWTARFQVRAAHAGERKGF